MSDSSQTLPQIVAAANADVRLNEILDALSPSALYGRAAATSTGLTWGYLGGRLSSTLIADGTATLAANASNYIVALRATGVVSASSSATNWNDSTNYLRLYKVTTGASTVTGWEDHRQAIPSGGSSGGAPAAQAIYIACGTEVAPLVTGTALVTFRMPMHFALTGIRASVTTAPTGSVVRVDVNKNGTSILSTKLTIDATEKTSVTAAAPAVVSDTDLTDDAEITIDIDAVGSTLPGAGLKVYLIGVPV